MSNTKATQEHKIEVLLTIRIDDQCVQTENFTFKPQQGASKVSIHEILKPFLTPFIEAESKLLERKKQALLRQQIFNDEF
ncbi:hypothetical protein [Mannheimia granulomatis]|uniref:hypothetical protein n=1 Tax=Mannheimia granulomatis TaxID=85402 RepID=UPI00047A50A9|nr:hypothetical protein [Mannheimia granulomatis]QLB18693.1 hypothetical protein A6B41_04130 [Mannheimia granulomatis]